MATTAVEPQPSTSSAALQSRLGLCEVCNGNTAKYSCPKCEVKTCCLICLNIHKNELECTGIRDKTKYLPIKSMNEQDFAADYAFLEDCTRYVACRKRDRITKITKYKRTPQPMAALQRAAAQRKVSLKFLLEVFSRHTENKSFFDHKTKKIFWHVEWIYFNVDERIAANYDESLQVSAILQKQFNEFKSLQFYQSRGVAGVRIFLKAENVQNCKNRVYELDAARTLNENFAGKNILEFPTIYVCYNDNPVLFDIIDEDECSTDIIEKLAKDNSRKCAADAASAALKNKFKKLKVTKPKNLLFTEDDAAESDESDSDED